MSLDVSITGNWENFSLNVDFSSQGEILGILGASGSGKSMTLKCVAGIETPRAGRISAGGRILFDANAGINLKPQRRKTGYLFQSYALFPHMSVEDNIGCALPRDGKSGKVAGLISRFRLEGLEKRYPGQLSGGQQQRAALARIFAYEPETLLLDEPFSALDSYLREQLQVELWELLKGYTGSVALVTHSRDEVYRLCNRLVVLEHGRSLVCGDTKDIFQNPGLLTVARLTGCKNFSRAIKTGENTVRALDWALDLEIAPPIPDGMEYIGVRAHDFKPAPDGYGVNRFPITVKEHVESPFEWNIVFTGSEAENTADVWWKAAKDGYAGIPDFLTVRPQDILLLKTSDKT